MSLEAIEAIIAIAAILFSLVQFVLGWIIKGLYGAFKSSKKEVDDLSTKLDQKHQDNLGELARHARILATLEERLRNAPTNESVGRVYEKINDVGLQIAKLAGGQEATISLLTKVLRAEK